MRRAWGPVPGFPLTANGAKAEVRGVNFPSYRSGTLSNDSDISIEFNKGLDTAVCLLPINGDVDVIDFITTTQMCDFGVYSTEVSTHIDFEVANDTMNVFATLSDNAEFARHSFGHGVDDLQVLVGHYADLMPTAFTPCFSKNNLFASTMEHILEAWGAILATIDGELPSAAELLLLGTCVYEVDMVVPSEDGRARSRGVTSHEYGHWAMCNLLDNLGINLAYNAAIIEAIEGPTQPGEDAGECNQACGNEAFADFWSAQVVGGSAYHQFSGAVADISGWTDNSRVSRMFYCTASNNQCFDDNVGGPLQTSARGQFNDTFGNRGRVTSIFHDFVDGVQSVGSLSFTNGNYWSLPPAPTISGLPQLTLTPMSGGTINDELISLPGTRVADAIINRDGISIDQDALFIGLSDQAYLQGANWCQLCRLFANHAPDSCNQINGEPVCVADYCSPVGTPATCSQLESNVKLYSYCSRSQSITKWIGPPPSTSNPTSCNFLPSTSCPAGQIISLQGTCIVPPCPIPQVLERDGTCQSSCTPQDVLGEMTETPIGNGRCLILVP
jgi:hypothetical protein